MGRADLDDGVAGLKNSLNRTGVLPNVESSPWLEL
jgi:hypothetical protein